MLKRANKYKKIYISIAMAIFAILLILMLGFRISKKNDNAVLYINGDPVGIEEFTLLMQNNRASTVAYFSQNYSAEYEKGFWETSYQGISPAEFLKKQTAEQFVKNRVINQMASKRKMGKRFNYSTFLQEFEKENQRRKNAKETDRVIYGPEQYTLYDYYQYVHTNLEIELSNSILKNEITYTQAELKEYYNNIKDEVYRLDEVLEVQTAAFNYGNSNAIDAKETMLKEISECLSEWKNGMSFEEVKNKYSKNGSFETKELNSLNNQVGRMGENLEYWEAVTLLSEGEYSHIIDDYSSFHIIKCISKKQNQYLSIKEVEEDVEQRYLQEKYDAILQEKVKKAKVKKNDSIWEKIEVE